MLREDLELLKELETLEKLDTREKELEPLDEPRVVEERGMLNEKTEMEVETPSSLEELYEPLVLIKALTVLEVVDGFLVLDFSISVEDFDIVDIVRSLEGRMAFEFEL